MSGKITLTAVRYRKPVGKMYDLDENGKLKKVGAAPRGDYATAVVKQFTTPDEAFDWIESLDSRTLQVAGTFLPEVDGEVVRNHPNGENGEIQANSDALAFREGPGSLKIDVDYKSADEVLALYPENPRFLAGHQALRDFIVKVAPSMAGAAMHVSDSSSSFIHVDGKQITGRRGMHAEIIVDDARLIPELLAALQRAAWAEGFGWAFVSRGASFQARSPFDQALGRPTQPFFGAAPLLNDRITAQGEITRFPGGIANAEAALADLGDFKEGDALAEAEEALRETIKTARVERAERLAPEYAKRAGISVARARKDLIKAFGGTLPVFFELTTKDGKSLTAGDLWSGEWDGAQLLYPFEPDYQATTLVRYTKKGQPFITSFAHGYHRIGVAPLPFDPPADLAAGLRKIVAGVGKVVGHEEALGIIDQRALAAELSRLVRSRTENARVYRMHTRQADDATVMNSLSAGEFFGDVLNPYDFILVDNLPKTTRGVCFERWLGEERLTPKERARISAELGSVAGSVCETLVAEIRRFWRDERQVDLLCYETDMFTDEGRLAIANRGSQVTATVVQPHKPFDWRKYDRVTKAEAGAIVDDFKEHFPKFDEMLDLMVAARFATDGREAFHWMQAQSSFGKNFVVDGVFGPGLDGRGLNIIMSLNLDQVEKALSGAPSPIDPAEHAGAWVLFCDEFKAVGSSLKLLNNTLRVAPKNRMMGELRLFLKLFTSDEDAPSLSQGGVDRQLANRFSYWNIDGGRLTDRKLYSENSTKYLEGLRRYAAYKLDIAVEEYRKLGRVGATVRADKELRAFHSKYAIGDAFGTLDEELPLVAADFVTELLRIYKHTLPSELSHEQRAARGDLMSGFSGASVKAERIYILRNPEVHLEAFLKRTRGRSEVAKYNARKTELIDLCGTRSNRNTVHHLYKASATKEDKFTRETWRGVLLNDKMVTNRQTAHEGAEGSGDAPSFSNQANSGDDYYDFE